MPLVDGAPPYSLFDLEHMARALVAGEGWGVWLFSKEAPHAFPAFFRKEPQEKGCIYLYEFAPRGKLKPTDIPRFMTVKWLDLHATRVLLLRVRELEVVQARGQVPAEKEIEFWCQVYEKARLKSAAELREKLGLPQGG